MSGFRGDPDPSEDWISEEVEKQKERDAAEIGEGVVVIEETDEFGISSSGRMVEDGDGKPVNVDHFGLDEEHPELPTPITPEEHRKVGVAQAGQIFREALELVDLGRDWLDSIGYRDATRERAAGAAEAVAQVINLIEAGEGSADG